MSTISDTMWKRLTSQPTGRPASKAQIDFISQISETTGISPPKTKRLTLTGASRWINQHIGTFREFIQDEEDELGVWWLDDDWGDR